MTSSYKRGAEFKSKTPARFSSGSFDCFKNLQFACLRQALQDATGNSPYYRKQAVLWLNGQDCYDLLCELSCEDVVRDYLQERGLILRILIYNNPQERKVIPLFLGKDAGQQL